MSKSTKWFLIILGILAFVAIGFVLLFIAMMGDRTESAETIVTGSGDRIAVIDLDGVITSSEDINRQLKKYRESSSIEAILLHIDSPGGGVVASQEIYEEVRKTRDAGKPVVVSMGSIAASGGYYVACGASRLVANRGTLTASIGVISEFLQLHEAFSKLGIDVKTVKAGRMKDAGSPARPMTGEDERYFQSLMDQVHGQFIAVVERERKMSHEAVLAVADGRVFTGEQALEIGLVDTLGTYEDAVKITAELGGIQGEPAIVKERKRQSWFPPILGDVGGAMKDLKQEILNRPVLSYRYAGPF